MYSFHNNINICTRTIWISLLSAKCIPSLKSGNITNTYLFLFMRRAHLYTQSYDCQTTTELCVYRFFIIVIFLKKKKLARIPWSEQKLPPVLQNFIKYMYFLKLYNGVRWTSSKRNGTICRLLSCIFPAIAFTLGAGCPFVFLTFSKEFQFTRLRSICQTGRRMQMA